VLGLGGAKKEKKQNGDDEPASTKYLGWRILCGGVVVTLALGAVVLSLHLVLGSYDTDSSNPPAANGSANIPTATATSETTSVSAASVVAVLTPVIAGIIGIAGLFFGISATGSLRGRQTETQQEIAEASVKATTQANDAVALAEAIKQEAREEVEATEREAKQEVEAAEREANEAREGQPPPPPA
jgi:hypothetical protein